MRISFLLSSLWLSGGTRVVVEYANRLSARGHLVSLVIPNGAYVAEVSGNLDSRVRMIEAGIPLSGTHISILQKLKLACSMALAVPKSDVIIATHTPTTVVSFVSAYLLGRGNPVWFYMDYPGMFVSRPLEAWLLKHALNWHRAALVLSNNSALELQSFRRGKVFFVGLGLNRATDFHPLTHQLEPAHSPATSVPKRVFYLGDFRPRKGLADFLSAAEIVYQVYPELELWIALKEDGLLESPVPHRCFYRPSDEELTQLYATCDLFVSASWYEGFGLPPLEAMACGAPVVMTDSGGVRDYARHEENCLLVLPKQPAQLAQAMQRVLEDSALEKRLRRSGPPTAAQFTWEIATDRFEQALLTVCGSQSSSRPPA